MLPGAVLVWGQVWPQREHGLGIRASLGRNVPRHPPKGWREGPSCLRGFHPLCPIGHIVIEYSDALDCNVGHEQVAGAVDTLIHIEVPTHVPGHFGGGAVVRRARSSKIIFTA